MIWDVATVQKVNTKKLASYGLTVDSYLLPTSKSRDTKTSIEIKHLAPISFRYCALK